MQQEMISPKKNETRNGLAFEVILGNPKGTTPAKLTPSNTPTRILTNEDIKNKLQRAEQRRQSLEMAKLSGLSEKLQKIEEAAKIRDEQSLNFSKQTEQKLLSKMETNKENRANLMNDLMEKLRKTDAKIAQIRELTNQTTQVLEEKIKNKLISAEENRLEKITTIQERLKEHEKHVEEVRKSATSNDTKDEELEEKILQKLQHALNYREEQLEKIKEKLREHEKHVNEVREKARNGELNNSTNACQ